MGHQDSDLELRAMFAEAAQSQKPDVTEETTPPEATPVALDPDFATSWRETARFFRKAA